MSAICSLFSALPSTSSTNHESTPHQLTITQPPPNPCFPALSHLDQTSRRKKIQARIFGRDSLNIVIVCRRAHLSQTAHPLSNRFLRSLQAIYVGTLSRDDASKRAPCMHAKHSNIFYPQYGSHSCTIFSSAYFVSSWARLEHKRKQNESIVEISAPWEQSVERQRRSLRGATSP